MVRKEQQYSTTVVRRRPARHGAMGRGSTRLPLLGAPAASSRRRRTTPRGYSSPAQSIRLSTGRMRVRIPLVSLCRSLSPSGARAVPHSPRAGGAARNQTRTHAVVAQRNESTWLRTRGSGVRISPTALAAVDRRSNSESTSTADSERGDGRSVPLRSIHQEES